jgi:hypothetical protein
MKKTILTYDELLAERTRLEALLEAQKELIKIEMDNLKAELKPATNVLSFAGNFTQKTRSNPLLGMAVSLSTDILMRTFFLKKAGWAVKALMPFVIKKVTNKVIGNAPASKPGLMKKVIRAVV